LKPWGLGFSPSHTLASKLRGRKRAEELVAARWWRSAVDGGPEGSGDGGDYFGGW